MPSQQLNLNCLNSTFFQHRFYGEPPQQVQVVRSELMKKEPPLHTLTHVAVSSHYLIKTKASTDTHAAQHAGDIKAQNSMCSQWGVMEGLCYRMQKTNSFIFNNV